MYNNIYIFWNLYTINTYHLLYSDQTLCQTNTTEPTNKTEPTNNTEPFISNHTHSTDKNNTTQVPLILPLFIKISIRLKADNYIIKVHYHPHTAYAS